MKIRCFWQHCENFVWNFVQTCDIKIVIKSQYQHKIRLGLRHRFQKHTRWHQNEWIFTNQWYWLAAHAFTPGCALAGTCCICPIANVSTGCVCRKASTLNSICQMLHIWTRLNIVLQNGGISMQLTLTCSKHLPLSDNAIISFCAFWTNWEQFVREFYKFLYAIFSFHLK